jgi:hypothetical protein
MANPKKYKTATTNQEHLKQQRAKASEIKSNTSFATPGTKFKVTKPGASNQPERVTSGDRAKEGLKKALKVGFTAAAPGLMYGSPAKQTVDPTTGNVIPDMSGTGPTNSMNTQTAATVQAQADALAIKENRAAKPNNPASSAVQTPMTMQGNFRNSSIATASNMFGNVSNPVPSPSQFNPKLEKAVDDGKIKGEFADVIKKAK